MLPSSLGKEHLMILRTNRRLRRWSFVCEPVTGGFDHRDEFVLPNP
jgi:hypothetical protein